MLRQTLNVALAASMPVTTYVTFHRGTTVGEPILSGPNDPPIVPAGYAFSIQGLTYASSIASAVCQALPSQPENDLRCSGWAG